jgi:hypothetical protein
MIEINRKVIWRKQSIEKCKHDIQKGTNESYYW